MTRFDRPCSNLFIRKSCSIWLRRRDENVEMDVIRLNRTGNECMYICVLYMQVEVL